VCSTSRINPAVELRFVRGQPLICQCRDDRCCAVAFADRKFPG
jgi:hypothetical protein